MNNAYKKGRYWLIAIIAVAVLLRVGTSLYLGDSIDGPQQVRIQDQVSYNALAHSLLQGKGYSFDQFWYPFTPPNTPTSHWSFLYPAYLSGIYIVFGSHPLTARIVQAILCGILSIWLIYRLGRRFFGEVIGLVAAGLGTVYAYFVFYNAALMTESFFIVGILALFELTFEISGIHNASRDQTGQPASAGEVNQKQIHRVSPGSAPLKLWLLLGVVAGITTLLRQTILLWLPFLILWMVWFSYSQQEPIKPVLLKSAFLLLVVAAFILPWTARNYLVYGQFLPLNSNTGYALYASNHPNHGTHFDQDYVAPLPKDLEAQGLNEAQWNTELTTIGLQFILDDPGRYVLLSLSRFGTFFRFDFSHESDLASNLVRLFSFGLYLPFFLYGLFLSRSDWRKASLFYLFAVVYSLMHILTWASIRYRLPIDAVLMPFAALAVGDLLRRLNYKLGWAGKRTLGKDRGLSLK
jgi:4-amino-4-deoxy-L-arabinose transferase-like glycosyltransferase